MGLHRVFAATGAAGREDRDAKYDLEGMALSGSWNPEDGTVQIMEGASYGTYPDSGDQPVPIVARLQSPARGQQYGPRGGERMIFRKALAGYTAHVDNSFDDSPGAPGGEWWQVHYNAAGEIDAYIKLTNDGVAQDDGGLMVLVGTLLSIATAGGLKIVARDDTAQIGVGDDPTSLDPAINAAVMQDHLNTFAASIMAWANENFEGGSGAATEGPVVPDCSQTVLIKG